MRRLQPGAVDGRRRRHVGPVAPRTEPPRFRPRGNPPSIIRSKSIRMHNVPIKIKCPFFCLINTKKFEPYCALIISKIESSVTSPSANPREAPHGEGDPSAAALAATPIAGTRDAKDLPDGFAAVEVTTRAGVMSFGSGQAGGGPAPSATALRRCLPPTNTQSAPGAGQPLRVSGPGNPREIGPGTTQR